MFDAGFKRDLHGWHYNFVHWCVGYKATTIEDLKNSPLPMPFYNHWCPIFWLTLFCTFLLPVIITWKTVKGTVIALYEGWNEHCKEGFYEGLDWIIDNIIEPTASKFAYLFKREPKEEEEEKPVVLNDEQLLEVFKIRVAKLLSEAELGSKYLTSYEDFIDEYGWKFRSPREVLNATNDQGERLPTEHDDQPDYDRFIKEGWIKDMWESIAPRVIEAKEARAARLKRKQDQFLKISMITQTVFSVVWKIVAGVAAVFAVYATIFWLIPGLWWLICLGGSTIAYVWEWFGTRDWLYTAQCIGEFLLYVVTAIAVGVGAAFLIEKFELGRRASEGVAAAAKPIGNAIFGLIKAFFTGVGNAFTGTVQIIVTLYENKCPPVHLYDSKSDPVEGVINADSD